MADSIDEKRDDDNEVSSGNGSGAAKKRTSFFGRSDGEAPVIGKFGSSFRKGSSSFSFGRSTGAFSRAAGTLKDRLKNLSKKDLAFVAMGLSVLVAAPVAEHMISAPPAGTGELTPGFGDRRKGVDGSVYEPGINALSQGSPDGSGEVITPLSSRDPMSLILGSSPAQPPSPPPAPPSGVMNTMRDAVRNSMAQVSKSAGAPTVIPKMQTAFRGISSVLSGDNTQTKGTGGLGGAQVLASAKNASGKAASRSMVGPIGGADYKGVANSPNSANKGAFENLRGAAERASSNFSGGSGMGSLEKAANDSVFASPDDGGVSGGSGAQFNLPPGSSIKGQIQIGGESLAQMAARMRMQKALEWEAYKKYEIPKKVIDALIGYVTGALKDEGGGGDKGPSEADIMGQGKGLFCHRKEGGTIPFEYCNAKKIDCGGCVCGVNKNPNGSMCNGKGGDPAAAGAADPLGGKGGDPAAAGAPTAGGGAGGPLPSMSPESAETLNRTVFGNYDETLAQVYINVTEGGATDDARKQLECSLQIAGGYINLKADEAAGQVKAGADRTKSEAVARFDGGVDWAENNSASIQKNMQQQMAFIGDRERRAAAGSYQARKEERDGISVAAQNTDIGGWAGLAGGGMKSVQEGSVSAAGDRIAYARSVSAFYKKQLDKVKASADKVAQEYAGMRKDAQAMYDELKPLQDKHLLTEEDKQRIDERYKKLSGPEFYDKAFLWRGADPKSYSGGKVDARQTLDKEIADWNKIDPVNKYRDNMAPLEDGEPAPGNLLAALIRGYNEVNGQAGEVYISASKFVSKDGNAILLGVVLDFQPLTNRYAVYEDRIAQNHGEQ